MLWIWTKATEPEDYTACLSFPVSESCHWLGLRNAHTCTNKCTHNKWLYRWRYCVNSRSLPRPTCWLNFPESFKPLSISCWWRNSIMSECITRADEFMFYNEMIIKQVSADHSGHLEEATGCHLVSSIFCLHNYKNPKLLLTLHGGLCQQWGPCDELATCPGCSLPSPRDSWDWLQQKPLWPPWNG